MIGLHPYTRPMTEDERAGRKLLLTWLTALYARSVCVVIAFVAIRGTDRLPSQLVRLGLEAALFYHLYRGHPVAKWLAIGSSSLGAAIGLAAVERVPALGALSLVTFSVAHFLFAAVLIASHRINAFLTYQRTRPD